MLDYRLSFSIDVYDRNTTQLLLQRLLSNTSGFGSVTENAGTMSNRGLEMNINAITIATPSVTWGLDLNWSTNRHRVTSLPGGITIYSASAEAQPTHDPRVCPPIGLLYGFIVDRIYEKQEGLHNVRKFEDVLPGHIRIPDVNDDGVISAGPDGDFAIIGSPHRDLVFGLTGV